MSDLGPNWVRLVQIGITLVLFKITNKTRYYTESEKVLDLSHLGPKSKIPELNHRL